jgi:AcrR family transcriptional regulator
MDHNLTRDRILDAALNVIGESGACRMTLDAVAEAADVSKGGLLYHFPDKESLLRGVLDRHLDRRKQWMEQHKTGSGIADLMHARVDVVRMPDTAPAALPLLGVLALEPKLLKRPQAESAAMMAHLRTDPKQFVDALLLTLASTGLIVSEALGTVKLTAAERTAVLDELHRRADLLR